MRFSLPSLTSHVDRDRAMRVLALLFVWLCTVSSACDGLSEQREPACGPCLAHQVCRAGACVCEPQCAERACEPDGCGGTCACPDDYVQDARGAWKPRDECTDSCTALGLSVMTRVTSTK